jgi:pyridoxal phosphate enzyme (YggS family)
MPPQAPEAARSLARIRARIAAACRPGVDPESALLAVSKLQPAAAIRALAAAGQVRFGENYVQEAIAKQRELADLGLEWHLIGPLQSNKCVLAAGHFDWVHSVDRAKLVPLLARARDPAHPPLNVLLQVNVDDEASKAGCAPADLAALAQAVVAQPTLRLRGLMAIPAPFPDLSRRRDAFIRMRGMFATLQAQHPGVDTLSMGMSEDFELALAEGATLVRIGSALFGARPAYRNPPP